MTPRTVRHQHTAIRDDMGDLMTHRPLPGPSIGYLDPFLQLEHHGPSTYARDNRGLPFKPLAQRGFETLTLVMDGSIEPWQREDSGEQGEGTGEDRDGTGENREGTGEDRERGGERRPIGPGGVHWASIGRGSTQHARSPEVFRREGGSLELLRLRINLAGARKMSEPRQADFQKDDIPEAPLEGGFGKIRVIAGRWEHSGAPIDGPVASTSDFFMSILVLEEGTFVSLPVPEDHEVFYYVLRGNTMLSGQAIRPCHLIELEPHGEGLELRASGDATVVFGHAPRLGEPMVARKGFVMNTDEELDQAEADEREGRFDQPGSAEGT